VRIRASINYDCGKGASQKEPFVEMSDGANNTYLMSVKRQTLRLNASERIPKRQGR